MVTYQGEIDPQWLCPQHGTYSAGQPCPGCKQQERENEERRLTRVLAESKARRKEEMRDSVRYDYAKTCRAVQEHAERQGIRVKRVQWDYDGDDKIVFVVVRQP